VSTIRSKTLAHYSLSATLFRVTIVAVTQVRRMSLAEIQSEGSLDSNRALRVKGDSSDGDVVSVVYFRAG
jgi:hypothetical protein